MSGIIPVDDDEELEGELYDDVGQIDDDIYEVLPGLVPAYIFMMHGYVAQISVTVFQSVVLWRISPRNNWEEGNKYLLAR